MKTHQSAMQGNSHSDLDMEAYLDLHDYQRDLAAVAGNTRLVSTLRIPNSTIDRRVSAATIEDVGIAASGQTGPT